MSFAVLPLGAAERAALAAHWFRFVPPTAITSHGDRTDPKGATTMSRSHSSLMQLTTAGGAIPPHRASGLRSPARQRASLAAALRSDDRAPRALSIADDRGAATAEYAIATMAAVGFASLLVVIMRSDEVRGILTDMVRTALTFGG
ncbi:hypothetical protein ASC54_04650 [Yonghaparkia sp. Root332]|nr:hypothetical protein ASC54_04650 [Yonghaparkia sp. Root332]